ncbi:hypothetical protein M422DRAFT_217213 [Sphaerobolus stellatus SS14]|uniref:Nucleolar protein 16 n=1 Tax=Sphaerobolus stellatus (strain SS14) TaxID=990650 RepID=A0A0C9UG52_SPHS4|nr:hypothetical protein M422DRAFT_217213 [Sphaerobolus stellatus SS14]
MPNPRQRSKARSATHKKVRPVKHAQRNLKKMKPIKGPKLLQEAWDKTKTVRQNYAALGLVGSLKPNDSGGSEIPLPMLLKKPSAEAGPSTQDDTLTEEEPRPQQFGRIIRDAEGKVIDIELPEEEEDKDMEDDEVASGMYPSVGKKTELIQNLESLAAKCKPVKRYSSQGEVAELEKLIAKYGTGFEAMAKDRRLNPWQRTAGQLRRACTKAGLI